MESDNNRIIHYQTGSEYWHQLQSRLKFKVSPPAFNELLDGGILPGLIYHFTFPRSVATQFLLQFIVDAFHTYHGIHGQVEDFEVYFLDTLNRFDPYYLSREIRRYGYNPSLLLRKVQILRAFTWPSLVGACEGQLAHLPPPRGIRIICGNYLFGDFDAMLTDPQTEFPQKIHHDVKAIINSIREIASPTTYTLITGPLHPQSAMKPAGGTIVSHLANVHLRMGFTHRFQTLSLDQHPFLAPRTIRIPLPEKIITESNKHYRKQTRPARQSRRKGRGFEAKDPYLFHPKQKRTLPRGLDEFLKS